MESNRNIAIWIVAFLGALVLIGLYIGVGQEPARNVTQRSTSASMQLNEASQALADDRPKVAVGIYKRLAGKGNVEAEYRLAGMYLLGDAGVEKNKNKALELYTKAAKSRLVAAESELGHLYFRGDAFDQDFKKARYWLNLAANENNARAQFELGQLWEHGWGGEKNAPMAYAWYEYAARQDFEPAITARDSLLKAMTRDQIAQGQRLLNALAPTIREKAKAPNEKESSRKAP